MQRPSADERAPLLAEIAAYEQFSVTVQQWVMVFTACMAYIAISASLINYNKFLMQTDHFPYAVPLSALHMVVSFSLSLFVYAMSCACGYGSSLFPGVAMVKEDPGNFIRKLIPLSVFFAASIVCSNQAYVYCSVPFLQMCKEMNIVMVYVGSLLFGIEGFSARTFLILVVVLTGCCMSIHGEMKFSTTGFSYQLVSQVAEVMKILIQQVILQGMKIDPLTMVLVMSPLCLCTLAVALYSFWEPGIIAAAHANWGHLLLNGCNAFALNVCVAIVIRFASGVSFVLAGVVKDVAIVVAAAYFFGASIGFSQGVGFFIAVCGVAAHSLNKMSMQKAEVKPPEPPQPAGTNRV